MTNNFMISKITQYHFSYLNDIINDDVNHNCNKTITITTFSLLLCSIVLSIVKLFTPPPPHPLQKKKQKKITITAICQYRYSPHQNIINNKSVITIKIITILLLSLTLISFLYRHHHCTCLKHILNTFTVMSKNKREAMDKATLTEIDHSLFLYVSHKAIISSRALVFQK